jgi:hypothetical protein
MALINCRDCGSEIFDTALICPVCRAPTVKAPERVPCRKCGHLIQNDISSGWYGLVQEISMVLKIQNIKRGCPNCGVGLARINKYQMKLMALFSVCLAAVVLLKSLGPKEYQEFFFNIFISFVLWCFLFLVVCPIISLVGTGLNNLIFKSTKLEKFSESKKLPTFYALFSLSIVVFGWLTEWLY